VVERSGRKYHHAQPMEEPTAEIEGFGSRRAIAAADPIV
jgi:hypothetical protein